MTWTAGQRAVINRETIVTIERVTPSGRAVVTGGRVFNANGNERVQLSSWELPSKLEPLTDKVEAQIAYKRERQETFCAVLNELDEAKAWARSYSIKATPANVEKAERLLAAIKGVMA